MKDFAKTSLVVGGTAAATVFLLWLAQEDNVTKPHDKQLPLKPKYKLEKHLERNERSEDISKEVPLRNIGLEKIGDGTALFPDYIKGLHELACKTSGTKHGVAYFDNMGQPFIMITNPEFARKLLATQVAHDLGGMRAASAAFFGEKVLFILENEEWRKLRNIMRHSFLPNCLPLMAADITAQAFELCNRLKEVAGTGLAVDIHFFTAMYHISAVGKAAFNYDLGCITSVHDGSNKITESFEYLLRELPRRAYSQDVSVREDYTSPTKENLEWQRHASAVREVILDVVACRLEERTQGKPLRNDLLDSMILSYEREEGNITDPKLLTAALGDNLVEILFAGYNTSVAVISNAIYFVAKDPHLQKRLQEEADQCFTGLPLGEAVDLRQLKLAEAVFLESLRLVPPAPLIYRSATSPTTLLENGLVLPAGYPVWIPALFLQTDKASWGPDADLFIPDRWLKPQLPHPPGAFVPFSHGPRECLGKYFAKLESVTAIGLLFKNFSFTVPDTFDYQPTFTGFGLRPFDRSKNTVCLDVLVEERIMSSDNLFDWSPANVRKSIKFPTQPFTEETKT